MAEVLLDYAQKKFLAGKEIEAFDLASSAKTLDPFFGSVDRYYAVFRVHYEATKRNKFGETDLYALLGLKGDSSLSVDAITDAFRKLVKLVMHADLFCSPAAHGALRLITKAWEVLSDETTREAYDVCMGLRPPPSKPRTDHHRPLHGINKRYATTNFEDDVGRALRVRRLT